MIGVDAVEIPRMRRALERVPRIEHRLFTEDERSFCNSHSDPAARFATTMAAKEAVVKALGLSSIHQWARRIAIVRDDSGRPRVYLDGDGSRASVSMTSEKSLAIAVALRIG